MDKTAGKIIIDGNSAAALGCMFAGVTVVTWYPITPSSSLVETLIDYMKELPHRPGRQGHIRDRAGGRRTGGHRHGDWRRLGGRAFHDGHGRPGHFADGGVRRPGLLRRNSGRDLGHPARGALHRPAHAHVAGRHSLHRVPVATAIPSTSCCCPVPWRSASTWRRTRSTWPSSSRRWSS